MSRTIAIGTVVAASFFALGAAFYLVNSSGAQATASPTTGAATTTLLSPKSPTYLGFASAVPAGVSLSVNDSKATEFEAEDEDNDLETTTTRRERRSSRQTTEETSKEQDEETLTLTEENAEKAKIKGTIDPGVYVTPFDIDCSYELWRISEEGEEVLIGQDDVKGGRSIVNINAIEPDRFYSSPGCGDWSQWSSLTDPLKEASQGDYWIGDLAEGTWSVPDGCIWEKVADFRGAQLADVQYSGVGPEELVIAGDSLGIRIRRCSGQIKHVSNEATVEVTTTAEPVKELYVSEGSRSSRRRSRR